MDYQLPSKRVKPKVDCGCSVKDNGSIGSRKRGKSSNQDESQSRRGSYGPRKREPYVILLPDGKIVGVRTGKAESLDKYNNPYTKVFNIEPLLLDKDLYENRNGAQILRYLKEGSTLTDSENNELVRICCEHLQRCDGSMYPDTSKKVILAQSIVATFPQLASELHPDEPHALYFHRKLDHVGDDRHSGKITHRFDTIIRKANGKNRYKKPVHIITT